MFVIDVIGVRLFCVLFLFIRVWLSYSFDRRCCLFLFADCWAVFVALCLSVGYRCLLRVGCYVLSIACCCLFTIEALLHVVCVLCLFVVVVLVFRVCVLFVVGWLLYVVWHVSFVVPRVLQCGVCCCLLFMLFV